MTTSRNIEKRRAAFTFLVKHYGQERADYLVGEGWTTVYADIRRSGFAWSEREKAWHRSSRPFWKPQSALRVVKRYDYARVVMECKPEAVEGLVKVWTELVDLISYEVWQVESDFGNNGNELVRLAIFARREKNNG